MDRNTIAYFREVCREQVTPNDKLNWMLDIFDEAFTKYQAEIEADLAQIKGDFFIAEKDPKSCDPLDRKCRQLFRCLFNFSKEHSLDVFYHEYPNGTMKSLSVKLLDERRLEGRITKNNEFSLSLWGSVQIGEAEIESFRHWLDWVLFQLFTKDSDDSLRSSLETLQEKVRVTLGERLQTVGDAITFNPTIRVGDNYVTENGAVVVSKDFDWIVTGKRDTWEIFDDRVRVGVLDNKQANDGKIQWSVQYIIPTKLLKTFEEEYLPVIL